MLTSCHCFRSNKTVVHHQYSSFLWCTVLWCDVVVCIVIVLWPLWSLTPPPPEMHASSPRFPAISRHGIAMRSQDLVTCDYMAWLFEQLFVPIVVMMSLFVPRYPWRSFLTPSLVFSRFSKVSEDSSINCLINFACSIHKCQHKSAFTIKVLLWFLGNHA